jgi:putative spermidine/putrescine transport system permease protein
MEPRRSFYVLSAFFALFVLFLYGPTLTIVYCRSKARVVG